MCQTNGIRSSGETQAKIQNVIKKGMYVDEALAKTSECLLSIRSIEW